MAAANAAATAAVGNRYLVSGVNLVSRLTPMKRILCVCPTPALIYDDDLQADQPAGHYTSNQRPNVSVGLALSDPYLAYAFPVAVDEESNHKVQSWWLKLKQLQQSSMDNSSSSSSSREEEDHDNDESLSFHTRLLDDLGYSDVGAVTFALPMMVNNNNNDNTRMEEVEDRKMRHVRDCLREFFSLSAAATTTATSNDDNSSSHPNNHEHHTPTFGGGQPILKPKHPFSLQCNIDRRISIAQAQAFCEEEPNMWDEVYPIPDEMERIAPCVHATVALNCFLWKHTGGWRNTFA